MNAYVVDIYLGEGMDTDSIATYLVYAPSADLAEKVALGESGHLINAKASLIRNPDPIDEMDFDGILGQREDS